MVGLVLLLGSGVGFFLGWVDGQTYLILCSINIATQEIIWAMDKER